MFARTRDLARDVPTVCIPDDHDVYHGNLWGAGGRKAEKRDGMTAQDSGGYKMPPRFVNAVHRTQTAHLPDPVDPAPGEAFFYLFRDDAGDRQGFSLPVHGPRRTIDAEECFDD